LADAGYYRDVTDYRGQPLLQPQLQWLFNAQHSITGVNDACIKEKNGTGNEWQCMFPSHILERFYLELPLFIAQPFYQTDQVCLDVIISPSYQIQRSHLL
jgi:hypothetical protein